MSWNYYELIKNSSFSRQTLIIIFKGKQGQHEHQYKGMTTYQEFLEIPHHEEVQ